MRPPEKEKSPLHLRMSAVASLSFSLSSVAWSLPLPKITTASCQESCKKMSPQMKLASGNGCALVMRGRPRASSSVEHIPRSHAFLFCPADLMSTADVQGQPTTTPARKSGGGLRMAVLFSPKSFENSLQGGTAKWALTGD